MKKTLKRLLCTALVFILAFGSIFVTSNATDGWETTTGVVTSPDEPKSEMVQITVTTSKNEYALDETITFNINIKNTSSETIRSITPVSCAAAENVFCPSAELSFIAALQPGESGTVTCEYSTSSMSPVKRLFRILRYIFSRFFGGAAIDTVEYPYVSTVKVGAFNYDFGFNVLFNVGSYSNDIEEIVSLYNAAHEVTHPAPKGHSIMELDGAITGDGALGGVLKVASPIIQNTLENNSVETDYIPGKGRLWAEDAVSAVSVSRGGITEITIHLKEQTDGPEADAHTAGPVARGIGTLGNVNNAIESLGAELYSGKETIKLTYKDAYIKCRIDNSTGKIIGGTWHYAVHVYVGEAEVKLGLKFTIKNLKGIVDYTVTI